jgi:predicted DNA-binding transcriptional regulator AlpA
MTKLLNIREVQEALGVSRAGMYQLRRVHALPYIKLGGRLRFEPEAIAKHVADRRMKSAEQAAGGAA